MQLDDEFVEECLDIFNKLELKMNERNTIESLVTILQFATLSRKRHSLMEDVASKS